jgi:hypothetical protein
MKERLVKAIVASIKAGKFDEKLAATFNNYSNDFQAIMEMFRNVTLFLPSKICDNELQLSVYFSYLQKVVQTFGPEEIKPWHGLILGALEHDEGALDLLINSVIALCQLIMSRETAFAHVQAANLMGSSLSSSSHSGLGLSSFFSSSSPATSSPSSSSPASSSNPPSPHILGTTHPLSHSTGSIPAYSSPSPPYPPSTATSSSTSAISPSSPTLPPLYSSTGDAELLSPEHPHSSSPTTSRATYSTLGMLAVSSQLSPPTPSASSTISSISSSTSSQTNSAGTLAALASPTPTSSFRHKIFNLYFSKRTQTTERILVEYADSHTMVTFLPPSPLLL